MIRHSALALACCAFLCATSGCKPGACDETLLPGLWSSATYTIAIAADLSFEAAGAPNLAEIDVAGDITTDACDFIITDTAGQFACPEGQVGHYTFSVSATQLSLTAVDDPCDSRRLPLNGAQLTRTE
jgi:hypothetical protein